MAALRSTRTAQYPLQAEFVWEIGDTMTNTSGTADAFATVASHVFDVIGLPVNAIVIGGSVTTETGASGSTAYNVKVGDSGSDVRYLGTTDKQGTGITALVPTGYVGTGENIRLTVTPTVGTATAGKWSLKVQYVVRSRANEVQIT